MNPQRTAVIGLAFAMDRWLGDPPNRLHPVAWMGKAIGAATRRAPRPRPPSVPELRARDIFPPPEERSRFIYGVALVVLGGAAAYGVGWAWERLAARLPTPLGWLVEAVLFKMLFSLRGLTQAADEVRQALAADRLDAARRALSWHLVSRDTTSLRPAQVAGAAIESVAENASDGIVAPLFYYALGGLPAALAYRYISTCDSMLGYRDPVHEWLGKASARLDDLVNLVPARLTAALIILAAWLRGDDAGGAWRIWRRDAHSTASPNAGHPMSAMAGAVGVELEKVGHYRLGAGQRQPKAADIERAVRLVSVATLVAAVLLGLVAGGWPRPTGKTRARD